VVGALEAVLREAGFAARHRWYYPSVGEYASLLEKHGMTVTYVRNFQRWTQLEHPERGLREWLEMFGGAFFEDVPNAARESLLVKIEDRLRPELYRDGAWWIDYRRLRLTAERI